MNDDARKPQNLHTLTDSIQAIKIVRTRVNEFIIIRPGFENNGSSTFAH
jgi:hypothetical protein